MTELAALFVLADTSDVVVITLVVVFILIALGLWFSVWQYRKNLEYRRSLMFHQHEVKRCPSCNTVMDVDVKYCPNCGTEVPIVTTIGPKQGVPGEQ